MKMFADMLEFWFDRGVEGFRVDAITPVGKHPDLPDQPPVPEGTGMLQIAWEEPVQQLPPGGSRDLEGVPRDRRRLRASPPRSQPSLVAESYMNGRPDLVRSYVNDREFHGAFAFAT